MPGMDTPDLTTTAYHAAASPPETARWGSGLIKRLLMLVVVCITIAVMLYALEPRYLGAKLIYSHCIGGACWSLVELQRAALSRWWRRATPQPVARASGFKGLLYVPMLLLSMVIGTPLGLTLGDAITGLQSPSLLRWDVVATRFTVTITLIASAVTLAVSLLMERLAEARAQAAQAARLASENQLKLLQAQLEPHMLFNTLANLRVLIGVNPSEAQAMLDRLIAFLRSTLQATRSGPIPLAQEFAHLADYLALMQMRMGARLMVQLELPPDLRTLAVPALLLQPLVENSIRHGLEPQLEGGVVRVVASRRGELVQITVRDTGVGLAAHAAHAAAEPGTSSAATLSTHFGVQQVRERLARAFGPRAQLQIEPAPDEATAAGALRGGVCVTLTFPVQP
jgi:signal transduction histidine kinase